MLSNYKLQLGSHESLDLSFEERFSLLVDAEWVSRKNRHLKGLLNTAKFSINACIEDINYDPRRKLDRNLILRLTTMAWINQHQNILISGQTGCGKSFLACALGNLACRNGISVKYYRTSKLLEELMIAKGEGTFFRVFNSLKKLPLLILDDWGLNPIHQNDCSLLFELFEERYDKGSHIIISQLPTEHWHKVLTDPTLSDAILDRFIHNSYKINIEGDSMRRLKSIKTNEITPPDD
jgi:DNA replication protein DnaC